jgi:DNA-directed RNA polymerase specialized sigma24 family protein
MPLPPPSPVCSPFRPLPSAPRKKRSPTTTGTPGAPALDLIALDDALTELASFDPRQREVVELKYFAGLTIAEIATTVGISAATVEREWATARAWLFHRLSGR